MDKLKVAFICVHNSCRSQMAEAISKMLASDTFDAYSAGTYLKNQIHPDAVSTILDLYGIDISTSQKPKLLDELPPVDIVITMGCNVECPYLPSKHREDWGLQDPDGMGRDAFAQVAQIIEQKVLDLKSRIVNHKV